MIVWILDFWICMVSTVVARLVLHRDVDVLSITQAHMHGESDDVVHPPAPNIQPNYSPPARCVYVRELLGPAALS